MFEALFWPAEMRELVAKYRKQGCLNLAAIKCDRKLAVIIGIMFLILVIGFAVKGVPFYYYLAAVAIAVGLYAFTLRSNINRVLLPYTIGIRETARVKALRKGRVSGTSPFGWYLSYEYKGKQRLIEGLTDNESAYLKQQGANIVVLVHPRKADFNIPYFPSWEQKYSLKTIKEREND